MQTPIYPNLPVTHRPQLTKSTDQWSRIQRMTSFSIDLADDTAATLREIAEVTAETPDTLIRRAVEELVADYVDGRIALQRLADPSDAVISSAELRRRLAD